MWKLAIAALLASAATVDGKRTFTFSTKSSCKASAKSKATSKSKNSFIALGVDLGKKVCTDVDYSNDELLITVSDIAQAVAKTTVFVDAKCSGTKGSSGSASADGSAVASAEAHAAALLEGFAKVETCGQCEASVEIALKTTKSVFVEAISNAWVEVEKLPTSSKTVRQKELDKKIEKEIIPVYIEFLANLQTEYGDCYAGVSGTVETGDSSVSCEAYATSWVEGVSISSVAEAGVAAGAYTCSYGDWTEAEAVAEAAVVAKATAYAYIEAVSQAGAACISAGAGEGCVLSKTAIEAVVKAQAVAWAGAWAKAAAKDCGCDVSDESVSEEIAEIILEAASDAYTDACAKGDADASSEVFADAVLEASVDSVAKAYAKAVSGYGNCGVEVKTEACIGCVGRGEKCAGKNIDGVLGCCSEKDVCVQKNNKVSKCRAAHKPPPASWDGTIRTCDENKH